MNRKQKLMLARILLSAALTVILSIAQVQGIPGFALYMLSYLIVGYDILLKAIKGIVRGQVFDECFLMAIATVGAIALAIYERSGDYTEAVAVMLFYQTGELFQSYAVGKSRRNITQLMDIRPDYANIEEGGKLVKVDPDDVEIGSMIVVQPGEKVPLDGVVIEGSSSLDTSALTGESLPRSIRAGDGQSRKYWTLWRTQVRGSPNPRISSPGSPGYIPLQSVLPPSHSASYPLFSI